MSSTTQISGVSLLPSTALPASSVAGYKVVGARHPGRLAGTIFALIVIALTLHSILDNPRWGWPVFGHWFFSRPVLQGLSRTLELTLVASVCGFVLGTALALARLSRSPLLAGLAWAYIRLLRSIPLLVLLLILYNLGYLYRSVTLGIPFTDIVFAEWRTSDLLSQFGAAALGLSLNQAAFAAEIIRGGILSVDQGQLEAAAALGLPRRRQVFRIVIPQAMRAILPTVFNELIGLAKNISVVYILALPELFYTVQVIYQRNMEVMPLLMVATVWYLIILTLLSVVQYYIERHYARGALRTQAATPLQQVRTWLTCHRRAAVPPRAAAPASAAIRRAGPASSRQAGGHVHIQHVSKSYGTLRVLNDVTLNVSPGSVTAIIGPSGSGKSTLLRTINHLEKADSGLVSIDGGFIGYRQLGSTLYELGEKDILRRRVQVGMVFQNFNLFPHLTVVENVVEAPVAVQGRRKQEARDAALDLLGRVGLAEKADAYPRQLSGGQQQRVAIARALALRPKVLLFDEPTSALDPELVGEVLAVIGELARSGTTLIIVTHEIGFAREMADTIAFIDGGEILEVGPPAQILGAPRHARTREFLAKVL